ncbi:hypothetical protein PRIPAC_77952 [Pristionchus pacificus]|uniref:Uncharacterized protein n=1 Tax=Pristionchus pacificus TaxID=54126 RepID=A0A2A6BHV9_PRIPA|nr:hypothetical protein PRIPAC_77952 [Pristionchus pacificus]|eukprot:PDM65443.1 hypothetical protein PRIPAC_52385 [Pristionchus pacificus]
MAPNCVRVLIGWVCDRGSSASGAIVATSACDEEAAGYGSEEYGSPPDNQENHRLLGEYGGLGVR